MSHIRTPHSQMSPRLRSLPVTALSVAASILLSGCGLLASPNNPDVIYSTASSEAQSLQVPPDLTDISAAEQFVLPGTNNAAVTRNTLLPLFESMRFVREGGQNWLEFQTTPENIWPQLLVFLASEKYPISQTEPAAGVIQTQWRAESERANSSIFRNLVAGDDMFSRVGFRLERAGAGARLFARSQVVSSEASLLPDDVSWPASSHDPESTSALLNRFLLFLGVEQQKVKGILGNDQARAVLDDAVIQTTASGSEILINKGFNSAFNQLLTALDALSFRVTSSDAAAGRIEFLQAATPIVLKLSPTHVSAVRASVTGLNGAKLDAEEEQKLLQVVAEQLV